MKQFWEVIFDDRKKTMEVIGTSTDDTLLTNNVYEMQMKGLAVRCQTPDTSIPKEKIKLSGYTIEENLYNRLLNDYRIMTGKELKRW